MMGMMGGGGGAGGAQSAAAVAAGAMSAIDAFTTAKKQKKKAKELAAAAGRVVKGQVQKEFLEGERAADIMAQEGMPGLQEANQQLEESAASNLNAIRKTVGGANAAAAIAAVLGSQDRAKRDLFIQDKTMQRENQLNAINWKQTIGSIQQGLENQRIKERDDLLVGAAQLENAAEQNRRRGIETLGSTMTSAFGGGGGQQQSGISTPEVTPRNKQYMDTITPMIASQVASKSVAQSPTNYEQYDAATLQSLYDDFIKKGQQPPIELVNALKLKQ